MPIRDKLTTALDQLKALSAKFDQINATVASQRDVEASLVNVRASHDKALAELTEGQRALEVARAKHKAEMVFMETAARDAGAQLAGLAEGMQTLHDASVANLRKLAEARS
jgi:hypothetical protein